MANQDSLTGLWNHRFLHNHACKTCEHYCIALIDVDHFKKINDTFGHDAGDAALVKLAQILKASFPDDTVVRFGGEEFCIQSYSPFDHFIAKLENMREDVSKTPTVHFEKTIIMTISIGVTGIQGSLDEKIKKADDRLYTAKRSGRNQLVAYDVNEPDEASILSKLGSSKRLSNAVFFPHRELLSSHCLTCFSFFSSITRLWAVADFFYSNRT